MAFDGLTLYSISKELNNKIIGGKVDKIFEPNQNEILLGIYCNGFKCPIDIVVSSNNYRICASSSHKPNPTSAPNFCMVLRKYLLNAKIIKIYTLSLERIIVIEFEGCDKLGNFGIRKLIVELMGKHSNVILVDEKDIIIDSLRHFQINNNSYRNILPNYKYLLPISDKLDFTKLDSDLDFYNSIINYCRENNFNGSLSSVISSLYTGISKSSINIILNSLNIEDIISKENVSFIYDYILKIINETNKVHVLTLNENLYGVVLGECEMVNDLEVNNFIDNYYSNKEQQELFISYRNNFSQTLLNYMKKLNSKLSNIEKKLSECENINLYKLYGELITSNLYHISDNHLSEISLENYYDNNNLISIPLDQSISPYQNAKLYFKKYRKLKNAKGIIELQKQEVELEIDYLQSIIFEFQLANTIDDIDSIYNEFSENFLIKKVINSNKSKSKKAVKHYTHSIGEPIKYYIDGFTVIIGKNNRQNDYITKNSNVNDIWFHTKDVHGSHVILKTESKIPSQETINKCASIAAFYSKASDSSNVSVDYTYIKFVKKPSGSKPGMVIYSNNKNVIVKPKNYRPSVVHT